ncbi:MAG: glycosyltransferase family 39 protein [Candidatus Latescibacteria bacterium]|nr:glycosyltransferase family 39 protein [Candidatus Latescibacterota bacterium]
MLLPVLLVLGAGLRLWPLLWGPPVWHPDEIFMVVYPLNFFSGDLNPHHFHYPSLHFYLLGLAYGAGFLWQYLFGPGWSLLEFAAYHYFWNAEALLLLARLTSVAFALGTVWWAALLARRVYGYPADLVAALLVAVCTVHVRQSFAAGVDVALGFWFVGAVWAGVRLLERQQWPDYALAGALVGLAGATKYPGALAGAAVAAGHLLAGRSLADRRIWIAGLVAIGVFVLVSPYVLLDFETFRTHFLFQANHLEKGRADLGRAWWYHLKVSLRYGLGWVGLGLGVGAVGQALRSRKKEVWVLLAGFLAYYLVMGAGMLVFLRYALPLMLLLAVLISGAVRSLRHRWWRAGLVLLVALEPLYASVGMVRIAGREDTRAEARAWVEAEVPEGTVIGNFGGWAGDVQVQTFENLWWEVSQFEQTFGREGLDGAIGFLEKQPARSPFYSYVIQRNNIQAAAGSTEAIESFEPSIVVLHRHPLGYSHIDSSFASDLETIAEPLARFTPPGLRQSLPLYDPLDAFYVPLGDFGALTQPGPEVEIWKVKEVALPSKKRLGVRPVFARAYALGAAAEQAKGQNDEALSLAVRALELDPQCPYAYFVLGFLYQQDKQWEKSLGFYREYLRLQLDNTTVRHNLAMVYQALGESEHEEEMLCEALQRAPWKRYSYKFLAQFYQRQNRPAPALQVYTWQLERFPDQGFAHEELGIFCEKHGQPDRAAEVYRTGLERDARHEPLYLRLAQLHLGAGRPQMAAETCEEWLRLNPGRAEAHRLLAYACRSLGQTVKARTHAREALRLAPGTDIELEKWLAGQ